MTNPIEMNQEIKRDFPGGGFMLLRKMGDNFRLTANLDGHGREGDLTAQGVVEALTGMIRAFIESDIAGNPVSRGLGEETTGFMESAFRAFPELRARHDTHSGGVN